jgi:hypothetical protein
MVQIIVLGIIAGAAAALLFASLISGSNLSLLLVSIASLPILIAGIGWSHVAGLVAAVVASVVLGVWLSGAVFVAFLVGVGLPAWWLSYLALLARPGAADGLEWYPVGRIVVWSAILATAVVMLSLFNIGFDAETIRSGLRRIFEQVLRLQTGTPTDAPLDIPALPNTSRLLDYMAILFPPMAAALATITNMLNLWLAARVAKVSGRLKRPWPDLAAIVFPPATAGVLMAAIAGTFLPGLIGIIAGVLTTSLLTAYAILGFAVLHKITGGMGARSFVLAAVYAAVGLFGWPVLVMTVLGVADAVLDVRGRVAARRRPPDNVV